MSQTTPSSRTSNPVISAMDHLTLSNAIHTKTFWTAIVSAILTVVIAFGVPITSSQKSLLESAVAVIVATILGGHAVAAAHAKAAATLAQQQSTNKASS